MLEIGPGHGLARRSRGAAGWRYRCVEASPILQELLRAKGFEVIDAFTPPIPVPDASCDVVYADQVLEHMSGIDAARAFVAESRRALRPGGVFFVVVPDYLKERRFFWDVDYTHNFVTTERRVRQLLYDGGLRHARGRAQHRPGDRRAARPPGGGGAAGERPRPQHAVALHRHESCCSRSARTSSRR